LTFKQTFNSTPMFVAMLTTFDDPDPAHLRYQSLSSTGVKLRIEEDQETDWERTHAFEKASFLAVEVGDTPFQGIPAECYFVPTALDHEVVAESGKVTVITLKDPNERDAVYPVLLTLPKKGTLFQYQPETDEGGPNVTISELETKVDDLQGRVLYQASDMTNLASDDWFTYRLQDDYNHMSNVGTVSIKLNQPGSDETVIKTDTITRIVSQPFVIALVVIFVSLSAILIGLFSLFMYKRKRAREEFQGFLSLSEVTTDAEGGTTYAPNPDSGSHVEEVESPVDLSDSLEE